MIDGDRNQYVSLHTGSGKQLDQYNPDQQFSLAWGRELNNVSKCELAVPSGLVTDTLPEIIPWHHWISVWDETGRRLHWTGPVQKWSGNRDQLTVSAADISSLFSRQVIPITKRWDATDPAYIANELVTAMAEQQGINITPQVIADPRVDKFDYGVTFEDGQLEKAMSELADRGLKWAVSMGTPVLGPLSFKPIETLDGERDFMGGSPVITNDGTDMANEIIVRAPVSIGRARVPSAGLNLQRIVDIDTMFSVTNVQRAANQFVRYTAKPRLLLQLPGDVQLHPQAPVELDQLVPTARFNVEAYGLLATMELTAMNVRCTPDSMAVTVTMAAVDDDPPELLEFNQDVGFGSSSL